jgi:hypothetical protein
MSKKTCKDCLHYEVCDVQSCGLIAADHIICWLFKDKSELVNLPCKVEDTAYEIFIHHRPPFIQESTIEKIIIKPKGLWIKLSRNTMYETSISSLGKTIFLTREEAEKALAERNIE